MNKILSTSLKWFVILIGVLLILIPFWLLLVSSINTEKGLFAFPPEFWPVEPTFENYHHILSNSGSFLSWLKNSSIVGILSTFLSILISLPAAYAFAKKSFPGKNILFLLILSTMMVPNAVYIFPLFSLVNQIGLINHLMGMVLPSIAGVFGLFLLKQSMEAIPSSMLEAARIDGCGEYRLLFSIVTPISMASIAVLIIWSFMQSWNALLWPTVVAKSEEMKTLPVGIATLKSNSSTPWNLIMAYSMASFVPILVVFLLFRKQFVEGMTAGAVKG